MKLKIPQLSPYIFAVLFSAARLRTKVEPSHRAVFPAGQERVRIIWYRHNLRQQNKKWCDAEDNSQVCVLGNGLDL